MRVLTTRFVLGTLVLGSVCLLAETAEGGPFRRRARMASADPCCYGGGYAMSYGGGYYGGGYGMASPYAGGYGVAQSGYSTYGAGYATSPCWPASGGIAPGGGYYSQPYGAGYGGVTPAGGFPAPMPGAGGTSQPDTTVPANAEKVRMSDNAYEPATINITTGTTVRWTNDSKNPHTVTSDKGTWGSGDIPPGGEFTATFTKAGTFDYHCKHHPNMKGTIVVK